MTPDFTKEFIVESDAFHTGIGAILTQGGRPVAYFSKALSEKHQTLSVYDKEMMAILVVVKKWSSYLVGRHFKIKTDHQSLKFLLDQTTSTPAQQQWVLKMMGFDYEVVYRKGTSNGAANALSRRPQGTLHAITTFHTDLLERITNSWTTDPSLVQLISQLQQGPASSPTKYTWQHNQLRRKGKLVVGNDTALRTDLLHYFHSSPTGGHSGIKPTMVRLSSVLYWKGLKKQVRQFVRECPTCQTCKYDNSAYPWLLQPLLVPDRVWTDISMDFIEKLPKSGGKDWIMVVVDRLSKYAHFITMSHPFTALTVAQLFLDFIYRLHGVPTSIVSDRDKVFLSTFWKELFRCLGTKLNMSSSYHPQRLLIGAWKPIYDIW